MSCDRSSKQPVTSDTNYPDKDLSGMPQSKPANPNGMFAYVYFTVNGKHDSNAGPRWAKYTYMNIPKMDLDTVLNMLIAVLAC